jgi:hypothetical protein
MTKKASMDELNTLHNMVAKQLSGELDDPKVLSLAIRFLKDNEITADILESESMMSLTESIKRIATENNETHYSVEDMLNKTH